VKLSFTLLLLLVFITTKAQIQAPDTTCVSKSFAITSLDTSNTYTFVPNDTGFKYNIGLPDTIEPGRALRYGLHIAMAKDAGNYYGFFTTSTFTLYRLSFGTNPNSSASSVYFGNPGGLIDDDPQWIELVQDGSTWYGFITSGSKIIRLNFGTSLANTPVATAMDFTGYLAKAMQISVKKYKGQWIGFVNNYGVKHVTRLEFGSSLNNVPTAYNLPNIIVPYTGCPFTLFQQGDNWHMLLGSIKPNGPDVIVRLDFGTDLLNNSPTATGLGNPGIMNTPRGIVMLPGHDLIAVVMNEPGYLVTLNFGGDIHNTPIGTRVPSWSSQNPSMTCLSPYWYNDTLYVASVNYSRNTTLIRFPVMSVNNGITAASPSFPYTCATAGDYYVTILNDKSGPANVHGSSKKIVAIDTDMVSISAAGNVLSVPTIYKAYQWYRNGVAIPGATTAVWNADVSGTYTVEINNAGDCFTFSQPYNHTAVGVDNIKQNNSVQLYPNPATGLVTLDLHSLKGKVHITIQNMVGSKVQQYETEGGDTYQLDLTQLPKGMYNIRVMTGTQSLVAQLSLQ
jgi:hypothetical protein